MSTAPGVAAALTDLPDIVGILRQILARVRPQHQPILLAQRERVSAARYRRWAHDAADSAQRSAFAACAEREEEIARRVEALYPDAAEIQSEILARHPDLGTLTTALFSGYGLDRQFTLQARAERFGAATWRSFAEEENNPEVRAVLLGCADLEEESAMFLESISFAP